MGRISTERVVGVGRRGEKDMGEAGWHGLQVMRESAKQDNKRKKKKKRA
jgi:hypothetical protein